MRQELWTSPLIREMEGWPGAKSHFSTGIQLWFKASELVLVPGPEKTDRGVMVASLFMQAYVDFYKVLK